VEHLSPSSCDDISSFDLCWAQLSWPWSAWVYEVCIPGFICKVFETWNWSIWILLKIIIDGAVMFFQLFQCKSYVWNFGLEVIDGILTKWGSLYVWFDIQPLFFRISKHFHCEKTEAKNSCFKLDVRLLHTHC